MKKLFTIIVILVIFNSLSLAQHVPILTQYELNKNLINPAAVTQDKFNINLFYRNQWTGFSEAPKTMGINLLAKREKMSFGIFIMNDQAGVFKQNIIHLNYSYSLQVAKELKLAMGISGGMDIYGINFNDLNLQQLNDPWMQVQNASTVLPDFNAGMLLYSDSEDKRHVYSSNSRKPDFYAGISMQHILSVITTNDIARNESYLLKHFNLIAGYKHYLNEQYSIEGSILLKYVANVPFQSDITARIFYKDNYWLGLSYRTDGDIIFKLGMYASNKILFGYSFDFATSQIQNKTSHEIVLGYRFSNEKFIPKY